MYTLPSMLTGELNRMSLKGLPSSVSFLQTFSTLAALLANLSLQARSLSLMLDSNISDGSNTDGCWFSPGVINIVYDD